MHFAQWHTACVLRFHMKLFQRTLLKAPGKTGDNMDPIAFIFFPLTFCTDSFLYSAAGGLTRFQHANRLSSAQPSIQEGSLQHA